MPENSLNFLELEERGCQSKLEDDQILHYLNNQISSLL